MAGGSVGPSGGGSGANALSAEQQANANIIVATALAEGVGTKGAILAIMSALQESSLRNLSGGDRDSQGLFQQRPSMGWGTVAQVTDPVYATKSFLNGHGSNPGLKNIAGWQNMPEWQAIQAVQRSGSPQAYQKHLATATAIVSGAGPAVVGATSNIGLLPTIEWGRVIVLIVGVVLVLLSIVRITGVDKTTGTLVKTAIKIKSGKILK